MDFSHGAEFTDGIETQNIGKVSFVYHGTFKLDFISRLHHMQMLHFTAVIRTFFKYLFNQ